MGSSISNNCNSVTLLRNLFKYILIIGILGLSQAYPRYDAYNVRNEPDAIPMHLLSIASSHQVELPSNEVREIKRTSSSSSRSSNSGTGQPESCCPTVIDVIEPTHGKNRAGDLVELYQSENVRQRFYENSCAPQVGDRPCRFMSGQSRSRCTQQYAYTYAMVKDNENDSSEWKLDYIQIRSGCSCHVANTRS